MKTLRQAVRDHKRALSYQWERRPGQQWIGANWPGAPRLPMDTTYVPPFIRLAKAIGIKPVDEL